MKGFVTLIAVLLFCVFANAQKSYKFDFGNGRVKKGYTSVTPDSKFANDKGYGFTNGSEVTAVDGRGKKVTDDYITSTKPFYFSVRQFWPNMRPIRKKSGDFFSVRKSRGTFSLPKKSTFKVRLFSHRFARMERV